MRRKLDARGRVIRIDLLESQLDKNQPADIGIVADAAAALAALAEALGAGDPTVDARVAETLAAVAEECAELSPVNTAIADAIVAALPADAIVTTDSSQIGYWGLLNRLRVTTPNSTPYMATYATLGYGLPAAIGSRLAEPNRPAFAVVGDGALMFSLQEFMTVVEQRLDLTVIVVDNGGYAEIKQNEADAGIAPIGVDLAQPDWVALAAAFGGTGHRVRSAGELAEAVAVASDAGGLHLIHLPQTDFSA